MKIGNSFNIDMFALSNRSLLRNKINMQMNGKANGNGVNGNGLPPIQPRPEFPTYDFDPNAHKRVFLTIGELCPGMIELGWTWEKVEARAWYHCPLNYATAFLHGREGRYESIGIMSLRTTFRDNGIEIPENARFDISLNRYGRVTITGLDDADLARQIEEALSYDWLRGSSLLGMFVRSARLLEMNIPSRSITGEHIMAAEPFTPAQTRLMGIQSDLMGWGVHLNDLSLDQNGRIVGLPQELHDRIYGDRTEWQSGMEEMEKKWENWNINRIRDTVIYFLRNGTEHIPEPDISLTFDNWRMTVNPTNQSNTAHTNSDAPLPGSLYKKTI